MKIDSQRQMQETAVGPCELCSGRLWVDEVQREDADDTCCGPDGAALQEQ